MVTLDKIFVIFNEIYKILNIVLKLSKIDKECEFELCNSHNFLKIFPLLFQFRTILFEKILVNSANIGIVERQ